jgi:hypothetical protein
MAKVIRLMLWIPLLQVDRHRRNEASYRFRTQQELQAVEKERLRLEKDRRELELHDPMFYDFVDPEYVQYMLQCSTVR